MAKQYTVKGFFCIFGIMISCRVISSQESISEYGLTKGRDIVIHGKDLTDDKIKAVMGALVNFLNQQSKCALKDVQHAFAKFQNTCKLLEVEKVTFK